VTASAVHNKALLAAAPPATQATSVPACYTNQFWQPGIQSPPEE
jgi:hypothetical protein